VFKVANRRKIFGNTFTVLTTEFQHNSLQIGHLRAGNNYKGY